MKGAAHGFRVLSVISIQVTFERPVNQLKTNFDGSVNKRRGIDAPVIIMEEKGSGALAADHHIHMVLDGVDWRRAIGRHTAGVDTAWVHNMLSRYRDEGYTYLRDGGDKWGVCQYARQKAPDYGITYRIPLAPISRQGHYGGFIGQQYHSLKEYAAMAKEYRKAGADFIKIMISGLMDFNCFGVLTEPGLDTREIGELIHIAHEEGFAVMAHANGARTVEAAAQAGVDSVEHGAYLDADALWAMKEAGTVWVPTLSTIGNLRGKERFDQRAVEQILESALANVEAFAQMGGLVAVGTDAGAWAVEHGCGTEGKLLALAGVPGDTLEQGSRQIQRKF